MKKNHFAPFLACAVVLTVSVTSLGKDKDKVALFSDAEVNFKLVMKTLLEKHFDKSLTKDELYRAATAGMLESLNGKTNGKEQNWNKLLSPDDYHALKLELSGKVAGIGAEMKFDSTSGHATLIRVIEGSPADKAGLKVEDQILSVEGQKFKGKTLEDLVGVIRGSVGTKVALKVLREDEVLDMDVKRDTIAWTRVDMQSIDSSTALLTIGYFTEDTPKLVEELLRQVNGDGIRKLIVDVRNNAGGGFEQAIQTADYFLPKDSLIVSAKDRTGKAQDYKSKTGLLDKKVQLLLLTNGETKSGAELFVAALKENRSVEIVGEPTFGKWTAQSVESLPNQFALKYTVSEFRSPNGNSYQNMGVKPDVEVGLAKDLDARELHSKYNINKRIDKDAQLKAAVEILRAPAL